MLLSYQISINIRKTGYIKRCFINVNKLSKDFSFPREQWGGKANNGERKRILHELMHFIHQKATIHRKLLKKRFLKYVCVKHKYKVCTRRKYKGEISQTSRWSRVKILFVSQPSRRKVETADPSSPRSFLLLFQYSQLRQTHTWFRREWNERGEELGTHECLSLHCKGGERLDVYLDLAFAVRDY